MLTSFLIAFLSITGLMTMWWMVQKFWRKTFDEYVAGDEDVLEGRRSCSDCGCTVACKRKVSASGIE